MGRVRVSSFAVSVDGYGAGPNQSLENPLGVGGPKLHEWFYPTATFQKMFGDKPGTTGVDDDFARRSMEGVGAWVMGRNMFGPVRGAWPDESWRGWWGENPPYHVPVFVLTHHARKDLAMDGGTVFHFVTDGIESAMRQARQAAGDRDVRIGGGVETVRQCLRAGVVDEMHLAISPVALGSGESLFAGLDLDSLGLKVAEHVTTPAAMHVVFRRG